MELYALKKSEGSFSGGTRVEALGVPDDDGMVIVRAFVNGEVFDTHEHNLVKLRLRTVPVRPDRPSESEGSGEGTQGNVDGSERTPVQSEV